MGFGDWMFMGELANYNQAQRCLESEWPIRKVTA